MTPFMRSIRTPQVWHSGVRFAIAMVVADAIVWWIFRTGTAVVMGSFAVICLLYFLDYAGTARERLTGYLSATLIGLVAVALGSLLAGPLVLAVIGAFGVSFLFAYARVLRGYVARASVGLQGAFFLPLMADVTVSQTPSLLASWSIGSAVAITAGLLILPNERSGEILALLRQWLTQAAAITSAYGNRTTSRPSTDSLTALGEQIAAADARVSVGLVGPHERAITYLVNGTQWGQTAFTLLEHSTRGTDTRPAPALPTRSLLAASSKGFDCAAEALASNPPPAAVPDLASVREADLNDLTSLTSAELEKHYPARLISILAMRMLWLAGMVRGVKYPTPDIGSTGDRSPLTLLRLNLGLRSVWFTNAIRTGLSTAACVLLVRELGLQHGLWVALAALSVTQVSFSASTNGVSSVRMAAGAMVGVLVASLGALLNLPHVAFVILLPVLAFLAAVAANMGPFLAQSLYTPFALTNLAALQWATDRDLEVTRVENIALGVAVAAVFALLVFPFGLRGQLHRELTAVLASSRTYLSTAIEEARGHDQPRLPRLRRTCIRDLTLLESTLHAAAVRPTLAAEDHRMGRTGDALARDRLIGGDACVDLAHQRRTVVTEARAADAFADWWEASPLMIDPIPQR